MATTKEESPPAEEEKAPPPVAKKRVPTITLPAEVAALAIIARYNGSGHVGHPDGHEALLVWNGDVAKVRLSIRDKVKGEHQRLFVSVPETLELPVAEEE